MKVQSLALFSKGFCNFLTTGCTAVDLSPSILDMHMYRTGWSCTYSTMVQLYRLVWPRRWVTFADVSRQSLRRTRGTVRDDSYYFSPRIMGGDVIGRFFSKRQNRFWPFSAVSFLSLISAIDLSFTTKEWTYFWSGLLNPTNTGEDSLRVWSFYSTRALKLAADESQ